MRITKIFFYELFGTALLAYGIIASDGEVYNVVAALTVCILLTVKLGGAQYNPSVTLALFIQREKHFDLVGLIAYVLGQYSGAFFGAFSAWFILGLTVEL
jgi:glycerol uptake facilitator-like aquaporin